MTELSLAQYSTETGLIKPNGLTQAEYMDVGRFLAKAKTCLQWSVGDWYLHCPPSSEYPYPGYKDECCRQVGLNPESARRYSIVCKQYPPEIRIPGLSFGHHQAAGGIEDVVARLRLLTQSHKESWSVARLKEETVRLLPAPKKRHQEAKTTAQRIRGLLDGAHGVGSELHALALLELVSDTPPSKESRNVLSALRSLETDIITWRTRLGDESAIDESAIRAHYQAQVDAQVEEIKAEYEAKLEHELQRREEKIRQHISEATQPLTRHMTLEEYQLVSGCLHPDREKSVNQTRLSKAYFILKRLRDCIHLDAIPLSVAREIGWEKAHPRYKPQVGFKSQSRP